MTDFTQWAVLDPARLLYEIEQAHGSAIYDRWAYLDPVHAAKQTATALGVTITPADLLSPAAFIQAVKTKLNSGGPYVAKAVHFDGANASLGTSSLVASNSAVIGCAYWIKLSSPLSATNSIWVTDPNDTYNGQQGPGDSSGKVFSRIEDDSNSFRFKSTIALSTDWTCVILAMDGANGVGKLYFGDVDVTGSPTLTAALVAPFNGLPFLLGDDGGGDGATFDVADFRFAPGQNWLVDGDIPLATRRLFIDGSGKPADPSVATTQLSAPAVLLSGDHTAFVTNQGSGGAFTLTGALTDASTSPSS